MKVTFEKTELLNAITPALGCVAGKNTYASLEGIDLNCRDGKCTITSYDLEKGYRTEITCEIEEEGDYIISAQKLIQIVRAMPSSFITIEVNSKNVVRIYSGKSEFELHAIPGEDFPSLPELNGQEGFTIKQNNLKRMLTMIQFAIAQNSMRPELNGAYIKIEDDTITAVTCDGSRLALIEQKGEMTDIKVEDDKIEFILPGKTLTEVIKLISDKDENMVIKLARKHVMFFIDNTVIFSRLIENEYIDYERFIPKSSKIFVTIDREMLLSSVERALLVTEDKSMGQARSKLKCSFKGNILTVSSKSVSNKITDEIYMKKEGEDIEIGFNCRFMADALHALYFEELKLSMTSPLMSMLIEPVHENENERYVFLILPVKLND
ncbi:MAG: DNA polymerase III subunit beta [Clostridia bacterium]|nr:DNA polymerase III subunit beta [Clostridia bacterium]